MRINKIKAKTMVIGVEGTNKQQNITIDVKYVEQVDKFRYLEGLINNRDDLRNEINERIAMTGRLYIAIKNNFLS